MAVKATGAEVKAFYNDKDFWAEGVYHEDEKIEIDGRPVEEGSVDLGTDLSDTCEVKIAGGFVTNEQYKDLGSFEGFFKKWRAKQTTVTIAVSCPKGKLEAVKAAIKAAGGKVAVG